ncbi:MAG TPA: ABC transporter substrate-binding protein [Bryobacteraceae bacterium]
MTSLLATRTSLGVVALGLALLAAWTASDVRGRPAAFAQKKQRVEEEEEKPAKTPPKKKRVEEEEDTPKAKPKRKVIRIEEEEGPTTKAGPARAEAPATGDLQQLAEQAKHPGAQTLFFELSIPHDLVVFKGRERVTANSRPIGRKPQEVEPIPVYLGNNPTRYTGNDLKLQPLANNGRREKPYSPTLTSIEYVRPYEEVAQKAVRDFLKGPYSTKPRGSDEYLSHFDMLGVAEQALSAVLRWHESARQTGQRNGKEWDAVESGLREQLLDVQLEQMDDLAKAGDWDRVLKLTRERLKTYTDEKHRERLSKPVAGMIEAALKGPIATEPQKKETRKRLRDLVAEFPDNPVFLKLGETLRKQAERLLNQARNLGRDKNDKDAQRRIEELLRQAEETWELPELQRYKLLRSTKYPVLRVGVRRLPKYLSPGWACTDAERHAVELLFESLVELIPDKKGIFRYRPGLAERSKVVPLGRHFQLPRNAKWSNGEPLNASDIRFTVDLLKSGRGLGRSRVWGELLDRVEVKSDPYQVTLRLHQGYLDPLALMTFKVLPSHQAQRVDTKDFAMNPVCSGPFHLDPTRHSDDNRECMFFLANPSYSSRRDVPRIQEVRFYSYTNAVEELRSGKLDLVLDLTAEEAAQLREKPSEFHVEVPAPAPTNRRIYFLAINQNKLPDVNLRKALAYAINREEILDKHFRGRLGRKVHKALNGPFPAGSWACNPDLVNRRDRSSLDLHDEELARTRSKNATVGSLSLKYPKDDPTLDKAMKDLRDQVKNTTGIVLELSPCEPDQLRQDVERTQSYDLAYYHYDFPDETYWLGPLLGPRAAGGDSNIFNFTDIPGKPILSTLETVRRHRDFVEVKKCQWIVHQSLLKQMPFIPLWQLDPLLAYNRAVKPAALDPALVFTNIEEWRLQRE